MIKKIVKISGILFFCILIVFAGIQSFKTHDVQFLVSIENSGYHGSIVEIHLNNGIKFEEAEVGTDIFSKEFNTRLSFGFHNVKVVMDQKLLRETPIFVWSDHLIEIGIWPDECGYDKCVYVYRWPKFFVDYF